MDPYSYRRLSALDVEPFKELLEVFGVAFGEVQRHLTYIPDESHVRSLLARPHIIVLVCEHEEKVVGGLVAYEHEKFENKASEIYIYDLAVEKSHRRRGIATRLIEEIRAIGRERGARGIFVQAERGDRTAIKLYELFGKSGEPFHFDIGL